MTIVKSFITLVPGGNSYDLQLWMGEKSQNLLQLVNHWSLRKNRTNLEPLEFLKILDVCETKFFKNYQFLLIKTSHWFLVSTKWNIPIIQKYLETNN